MIKEELLNSGPEDLEPKKRMTSTDEMMWVRRSHWEQLKRRIAELETELFSKGDEASFKQADWK